MPLSGTEAASSPEPALSGKIPRPGGFSRIHRNDAPEKKGHTTSWNEHYQKRGGRVIGGKTTITKNTDILV